MIAGYAVKKINSSKFKYENGNLLYEKVIVWRNRSLVCIKTHRVFGTAVHLPQRRVLEALTWSSNLELLWSDTLTVQYNGLNAEPNIRLEGNQPFEPKMFGNSTWSKPSHAVNHRMVQQLVRSVGSVDVNFAFLNLDILWTYWYLINLKNEGFFDLKKMKDSWPKEMKDWIIDNTKLLTLCLIFQNIYEKWLVGNPP